MMLELPFAMFRRDGEMRVQHAGLVPLHTIAPLIEMIWPEM
jgi:hypothetical protein